MDQVGTKFIFFTAASMVLCFEFVPKRALITHSVFPISEQCMHTIKAFIFFQYLLARLGKLTGKESLDAYFLWMHKGLGEDTATGDDLI